MAAWFTIYCSRSVDHVTTEEIRAEIDGWGFHVAAEAHRIAEETVDLALASLKIERLGEPEHARFRLTYGTPARRPIFLHVWASPEAIKEEREEAEELLDQACGEGKGRARSHLDRVVEVVAVELGWGQVDEVGGVLAGMVSEDLASVGDGLICDPYDVWWAVENHCPIRLVWPGSAEQGPQADQSDG